MYIFNKITVNPQLPKKIDKLSEIANNLWWSWNTDFLKLFKKIDMDLWEKVGKNPVKFLKHVEQDKLEAISKDTEFLKEYSRIVDNYEGYMNSKNTWFNKTYPDNKDDLIAYFSAEYGLDEIVPIYSGGLGILSGDHLKSSSDLGLPLVAIGLLYKNGYFHQKLNNVGKQECEYYDLNLDDLPITPVKKEKMSINFIPSSDVSSSESVNEIYSVQSGDTMESILIRFYGSYSKEKEALVLKTNNLTNPNKLSIGQQLTIPVNSL